MPNSHNMAGYDRNEMSISWDLRKVGIFSERQLPTFSCEVEIVNRRHNAIRYRRIEATGHLFLKVRQVLTNVVVRLTRCKAYRTNNAVRAATKTGFFSPPVVLYKFQHCARPTLCIGIISKYNGGWINVR